MDWGTGNNLDYKSATQQSHKTHNSLKDIVKGLTYFWVVFIGSWPPPGENCWPQEHKPRLVETRSLMMLENSPWCQPIQECPGADQALLLENHMNPHYTLQGGTHSFEGISLLWPALSSRAIELFFSTSPKTLSSHFYWALVNRGQVSATKPILFSPSFMYNINFLNVFI